MRNIENFRRIVLKVIAASGLVVISALFVSGVQDLGARGMPCVYIPFEIPEGVISYGFPFSWLFQTKFVRVMGCGPILGYFSTYRFCIIGFAFDMGFYFLILSSIIWAKRRFSGVTSFWKKHWKGLIIGALALGGLSSLVYGSLARVEGIGYYFPERPSTPSDVYLISFNEVFYPLSWQAYMFSDIPDDHIAGTVVYYDARLGDQILAENFIYNIWQYMKPLAIGIIIASAAIVYARGVKGRLIMPTKNRSARYSVM